MATRPAWPGRSTGAEWVIDAGTGPGIQAARLAAVTDAQVVGMDLSESVVRARRSFTPDRSNLHYIQGDILNPPLRRESFDLVVADQVLHHTPDCYRAFRSMAELSEPGGAVRHIHLPDQAAAARDRRRRGAQDHDASCRWTSAWSSQSR